VDAVEAGQKGEACAGRQQVALRIGAAHLLEGTVHGPGHGEGGDEVEQDRGEHLGDAAPGAQRRGDPAPHGTRQRPGEQHERKQDRGRCIRQGARRERRRHERARVELSLGADVPHAAAEGERDAEPD
jgi:hypothetical protein